jgi:prophage regulatory protein
MRRARTSNDHAVAAARFGSDHLKHSGVARIADRYGVPVSSHDMLERLRLDPGTRTLGELLQERQWAIHEVERLADEVLRLKSQASERAPSARLVDEAELARRAQALSNPNRLIRMKELRQLLGLGPSVIYKMMGEGHFPRSVHLGERTVAWRLADVEAWQAGLK